MGSFPRPHSFGIKENGNLVLIIRRQNNFNHYLLQFFSIVQIIHIFIFTNKIFGINIYRQTVELFLNYLAKKSEDTKNNTQLSAIEIHKFSEDLLPASFTVSHYANFGCINIHLDLNTKFFNTTAACSRSNGLMTEGRITNQPNPTLSSVSIKENSNEFNITGKLVYHLLNSTRNIFGVNSTAKVIFGQKIAAFESLNISFKGDRI